MSRPRPLPLIGAVVVLILAGLAGGAWWYLFGNNDLDSAELVPANTILFASIPNAATLLEGYETSQAKRLLDSPSAKPLHDSFASLIGPKNVDLLEAFLPNLSGQSFIAVTHFDYDHPEKVGLIAAMKPKAGLGDFGSFLDKLKATWPDLIKQGKTGTGTVEDVDYDWIQGPGAPDKICVAQIGGWIVTTWGEASLQDWIERFRRKSNTSSLAKDLNYQQPLARVGDNPMTLLYVNYRCVAEILQRQMEKSNPVAADYLAKKLETLGGAAIATRFENGEIVDRFSFFYPRPAQLDSGMGDEPCAFDTLKFTGPDTRFYWASTVNWKQYARNLHDQTRQTEHVNPMASNAVNFLEDWAHGAGLDTQRNIIDALGSEISVQAEWPADTTWPEVGLFVKVDQPDDFRPTTAAIINSVRQACAATATVSEVNAGPQNFATLQFPQNSAISPTLTENGSYFGVFLTEDQAKRSFQRSEATGLVHNADFARQIGDKRNGAAQVLFLDSPYLLNRAYTTAMPYLSIAEMFDRNIASLLGGKNLPPDLTWLAPMGTWSCVITPDEEGIQGYSVSGVGNQGILLAGAAGGAVSFLQSMGFLPRQLTPGSTLLSGASTVSSPVMSPAVAPLALMPSRRFAATSMLPAVPPLPVLDDTSPPSGTTASAAESIITITPRNQIFFDSAPVPANQIGDFLKAKKAGNEDLKLMVHVDQDASPDILSTVMDAGASAGFGVLPYTYTKGIDSMPPSSARSSAAPMPASPATNSPSTTAAQTIPSTRVAPPPIPNSDGSPPAPTQPH